ncbi:MAG: DUF885 family protein [Phycisphaerae bacterium]
MIHRFGRQLVALAYLGLVGGCAQSTGRLDTLLAEAWDAEMQAAPTRATQLGDHRFDDRLDDLSPAAHQRRIADIEAFRRRLKSLRRAWLGPADRDRAELFARYLDNQLRLGDAGLYRVPINQMNGLHTDLPLLLVSQPLADYDEYVNYAKRLEAFDEQVDQAIAAMVEGMDLGIVPPRLTVEPVLRQIASQMVEEPFRSELYKPAQRFPDTFTDAQSAQMSARLGAAIRDRVMPAYGRLYEFIKTRYLPACRQTVGIWDIPEGERVYEALVQYYTTTALTPSEIHQIGLDELTRIHSEMDDVRHEVGFDGSLAEFIVHLRDDPQYRAPTGRWLMDQYAGVLERTKPALFRLFGHLPEADCVVKEIESFRAASSPVAYYNPCPADGSRPGYFYVNTYQPHERVTYTTEALTYHEAVPGHHLQFALHAENESLPDFQRHNYVTAYCEGWALYAEGLGRELGGYKLPLQRVGRLTYDAWRAARLVVDTGLHRFKWTRPQAIAFMQQNTALARLNIEKEIDRYIAWPGQALAYKIGEITFRKLRADAEERLGQDFDVRAFHDRLLADGPLPLDILNRRVKNWIEAQAQENTDP